MAPTRDPPGPAACPSGLTLWSQQWPVISPFCSDSHSLYLLRRSGERKANVAVVLRGLLVCLFVF